MESLGSEYLSLAVEAACAHVTLSHLKPLFTVFRNYEFLASMLSRVLIHLLTKSLEYRCGVSAESIIHCFSVRLCLYVWRKEAVVW